MNTQKLTKFASLVFIVGAIVSLQAPVFADDLQGAAEAVNRTQQNLSQENQALRQDEQNLQQDRRSGGNVSADLQAIQAERQALQGDQANYAEQMRQLRTYQGAVQGIPSPATVANPGYVGLDGRRWKHRPEGHYKNNVWYPNPQYQQPEDHREESRRRDLDHR